MTLEGLSTEVTEEMRLLERLRGRKKALEDGIGALDQAEDDRDEIARIEREIEELELELKQRRREAEMEKNMQALDTVEKAVAASVEDIRKVRESAEDVYDGVVREIARREGCDMRRAHYLAAQDPVAKRAYAQVVEAQERERAAREGAGRIAAYLG